MSTRIGVESLYLFDKVEWFDICKKLKPGLTWERYEQLWNDFQKRKQEHIEKLQRATYH